jgi:argininosuccinate lyase
MSDLSLVDLQTLSPKFEADVHAEVFDFEKSVERRDAIGGTSRRMIGRQVEVLRNLLSEAKTRSAGQRTN